MKALLCVMMVFSLSACGTLGGMVSGMGQDLTKLGDTISK